MSTEILSRPGTGPRRHRRPWANGYAVFAVAVMMVLGLWQVLAGVAALARDGVYQAGSVYTRAIDLTVWGWTLVLLGVLTAAAGVAVLRGRLWGSVAGVVVAQASMLVTFVLIPSNPLYSLSIIALAFAAIWALITYERSTAEAPAAATGGSPVPGEAARHRPDDRAGEPRSI